MNSQPFIAEQLSNFRRDELYGAAEDAHATKSYSVPFSAGRVRTRLADTLRLVLPVSKAVAQSAATGGRAPGN